MTVHGFFRCVLSLWRREQRRLDRTRKKFPIHCRFALEKMIEEESSRGDRGLECKRQSTYNFGIESRGITWELNLLPQPSTMHRKGLFPPWDNTCRSNHLLEQELLPCTLQPCHWHTKLSLPVWVLMWATWGTRQNHLSNKWIFFFSFSLFLPFFNGQYNVRYRTLTTLKSYISTGYSIATKVLRYIDFATRERGK